MTRLRSLVYAAVLSLIVCPSALSAAPRQAGPQSAQRPAELVDPPAHVSIVDGVAVLERDGEIDDSPANMPLLSGDRVRTRDGRVEILYADGATLHLDANTTVDFQSDELVRLLEGRIRLSIPGPLRAVAYRVDAPSGWAQINQPGEYRLALLRSQRGEELELAVLRGGADLLTETGRTQLRAGERAYAGANVAPSSPYVFNSASWDAFDRWSETQRDYRLGVSAQYLPDEVRPYAASFDQYGSWRSDATHGYVWYPTVSADWRPYYHGRWISMPSYGWTWVGRDRWDWPTHHYGRWGLSGGAWFWIPGRTWGAAWVSWAYAPDYVSWSPLGWNNRPIIQINVFNGHDRWHPWTVVHRRHFGVGYVHTRAVPFHSFDSRHRGLFASRSTGPDFRDYQRARPRSSVPIRTAGARTRAVPRGSSPIYTNVGPGNSRVDSGSRRVMVPPSAAGRAAERGLVAETPAGSRAVPRGSSARERLDEQPQVQSPSARDRADSNARRAATVPTPSAVAPVDDGRRGVRSVPRSESAIPGSSGSAAPGAVRRGQSIDAVPNAMPTSPGSTRERSGRAAPSYSAPPSISQAPPSYGTPSRRAPESYRPPEVQAAPRGRAPGMRDGGASAIQVPPSRRAAPDQARPSGGGEQPDARPSRRAAPPQARPSGGTSDTSRRSGGQPSARPSEPSGSAPAARPRSGGERTGGSAAPRRRGGV